MRQSLLASGTLAAVIACALVGGALQARDAREQVKPATPIPNTPVHPRVVKPVPHPERLSR